MNLNLLKKTLVMGAAIGCFAQASQATLSYAINGTTAGGATVNASADISISGNTMTVVLYDNLSNPSDVGSVLNGIKINIGSVTSLGTLNASSATTVNLSGATPVYGTVSGSDAASAYALSGSSTITLTAIGGGQPKYLIIGSSPYSAANGSLQNNAHNPFIVSQETFWFTLNGSGYSEDSISGVTFLFGTSSDYGTGNKTTSVPEPTTVVAGALLLVPLGVQTLRRMRK